MAKVIRLTEKDIEKLVSKIIREEKRIAETYNMDDLIFEKWEGDVEVEKTGEFAGMTIGELNKEIIKIKKENEKYKEEGKKVPDENRERIGKLYFAKRSKQGWPGKGKSKAK